MKTPLHCATNTEQGLTSNLHKLGDGYMDFTKHQAQTLIESQEEFPVDFDDAWQWLGYTQKKTALNKLKNNFDRGVDYTDSEGGELALPNSKASHGGHNKLVVFLTIECFKAFCMMAGTDKGREVRRYFLECERQLKENLKEQQSQPLSLPGEPYWYKRVKKFLTDNKVPPGYFSIFQETLGLVAELEAAGYILPDDAIPDMSIGKCWANYLRSQNVNPKSISVKYPHHYPGWAHPVPAYAYDEEYLPRFRKWFRENYRKSKLPNYLKGKDRTSLPALAKVLEIPLHLLTGQAS